MAGETDLQSETGEFSQVFNSFFGFHENPFNNTPDPQFFFKSRQHREALVNLLFGVEQRRGFIVLTGEIGAGKTTLCRHFLNELSRDIKTAVILNSKISSIHLLTAVAHDFGIDVKRHTKKKIYESMSQFLLEGIEHNQNACLVIDEAQGLTVKLLEEIRLLSNLETAKQKLIQIVLMGQPELKDLLMKPSLTQLRQRIGVFVHLRGLDLDDASDYIRHRLQYAGRGVCTVSFSQEVLIRIHQMTRGIPRLINTVCDKILMAAFAAQTREISLDIAESAFEEAAFMCA